MMRKMHKNRKRAHGPPDSPQALARCAKIIDERPRRAPSSSAKDERGGGERAVAAAKGDDKNLRCCACNAAAPKRMDSSLAVSLCKLGFVVCPIGLFLLFLLQCFEILIVVLSVAARRLVLPDGVLTTMGSTSAAAYIALALLCSVTKAMYRVYSVKDIEERDVAAFNRMSGLMSTAFAASTVPLVLLLFFMRPIT